MDAGKHSELLPQPCSPVSINTYALETLNVSAVHLLATRTFHFQLNAFDHSVSCALIKFYLFFCVLKFHFLKILLQATTPSLKVSFVPPKKTFHSFSIPGHISKAKDITIKITSLSSKQY